MLQTTLQMQMKSKMKAELSPFSFGVFFLLTSLDAWQFDLCSCAYFVALLSSVIISEQESLKQIPYVLLIPFFFFNSPLRPWTLLFVCFRGATTAFKDTR